MIFLLLSLSYTLDICSQNLKVFLNESLAFIDPLVELKNYSLNSVKIWSLTGVKVHCCLEAVACETNLAFNYKPCHFGATFLLLTSFLFCWRVLYPTFNLNQSNGSSGAAMKSEFCHVLDLRFNEHYVNKLYREVTRFFIHEESEATLLCKFSSHHYHHF